MVPSSSHKRYLHWLARMGIKPVRIYPGSNQEKGYDGRFNGTLRSEVLNTKWFTTTTQDQIVINP